MTTNMTSALIRPARPADGAAIAQVHVDTWRDTYAGILPDSYLVHRVRSGARQAGWRIGAAGRTGPTETTLVAELEQVVGFISFGPARHVLDRQIGEVYALYVIPDAQGQGLGRGLVSVALERLFIGGCRAVDVEVLAANPSRHFYTAMGARQVGQGVHDFAGQRLPVVFYRWTGA
ncbi:MAG: GNAT family N-acetyltransferase [Alphaproteobacteria bacterium]